MITFPRLGRAATAAMLLLTIPSTALAATPQQMLNAAVKSNLTAPYRLAGDIKIDVTDKPLLRTGRTKTAHAELRFDQRIQSDTKGSEASEGNLVVAAFRASGEEAGDPDITLPSPITFEWKSVNGVAYIKIHDLPSLLTDQLAPLGIDISKITGRWISLDTKELKDQLLSEIPLSNEIPENPVKDENMTVKDFFALTKISPLQVLRVESKKTLPDGRNVMRLRVRVNPAFVSEMYRIDRTKVGLKDADRKTKLADLAKRYAEIRKFLSNLHMAIEVDTSSSKLTRVELGGKMTEPTKDCDWNEDFTKQACKIVGYKTVQYAVGISVFPDDGHTVIAPSDATPFASLLEELSPPEPEPEPISGPTELMPELNMAI